MDYPLIDSERLKMLAESHYKEHRDVFTRLRKKKVRDLDDFVHELDADVFEDIDCLSCANCCSSLGPRIIERDIERLSKHLKIKEKEFIDTYLRIDEDGDYVFNKMPCPFLAPDNYCLVYEKRPKACRDYPHTHQPKFRNHLKISLANTYICPVVYYIFRALAEKY